MVTSPRAIAALLAALLSSGCITGSYVRARTFEPVAHEQLAALQPGAATLADALHSLGAPLFVWEWMGDGAALAWGWGDEAGWGLSLSVPVSDSSATVFAWDSKALELPGAVLFFGPDGMLIEAREGKLSDIRAETIRRRPAPAPEEGP